MLATTPGSLSLSAATSERSCELNSWRDLACHRDCLLAGSYTLSTDESSEVHSKAALYCTPPPTRGLPRTLIQVSLIQRWSNTVMHYCETRKGALNRKVSFVSRGFLTERFHSVWPSFVILLGHCTQICMLLANHYMQRPQSGEMTHSTASTDSVWKALGHHRPGLLLILKWYVTLQFSGNPVILSGLLGALTKGPSWIICILQPAFSWSILIISPPLPANMWKWEGDRARKRLDHTRTRTCQNWFGHLYCNIQTAK